MIVVNVHEAKTQLSRLLAQVEAGDEVVIARRGRPVAQLVPCRARGRRQPDVLKGKVKITEAFFAPLPNEELDRWEGRQVTALCTGAPQGVDLALLSTW